MEKRTTVAERAAHKANWSQSGQTKKCYCESAGIKYATFISWFKSGPKSTDAGQFIALPPCEPPFESPYSTKILLPNGIELTVAERLSKELLKTLYHV